MRRSQPVSKCLVSSVSLIAGALVAVGCAAVDPPQAAPRGDVDTLTSQQLVGDNGWTMDAQQPVFDQGYVTGTIVFSNSGGPSTRKAGACLLTEVYDTNGTGPIACSGPSDTSCDVYVPANSNGHAYCLSPNNFGGNTCWVRPGSQGAYCVGSPANGGVAIGPGTYTTPSVYVFPQVNQVTSGQWMLDGCYSGCAGTTPTASTSSVLDGMEADCEWRGMYWADGQCWESQEVYDCETQPPQGLCLYYQWQDNQCECVV